MDSYVDYSAPIAYQEMADDVGNRANQHAAHYGQHHHSSSLGDGQKGYYGSNAPPSMVDIKPRLTKSQHEMLENEYNKQNKPSTNIKKGFAETLGVSLDKVNNWFQNRRAKSKQDTKKAAGGFHMYSSSQQAGQRVAYSSDSDTSPAFPSDEYAAMMNADERPSAGTDVSSTVQREHCRNLKGNNDPSQTYSLPPQVPQEAFDSPQENNRRTLTQEQFNAYAQHGGLMDGATGYDVFNADFSGDQQVMYQIFPELHPGQLKQQDVFAFQSEVPPSMSSIDSSIPSNSSEQSISTFPSLSSMRHPSSIASDGPDWADSRSSSVSLNLPEITLPHAHAQAAATVAQWQPGQSVPVDFNAMNEEFRQMSQARRPDPFYRSAEQPLAWPTDDTFERRDSASSSLLAQSMGEVGLSTPPVQQSATFKTPAPPTNIATRRQRPRPATLGLAAMRSQSYSGAAQPTPPGQVPQHNITPGASASQIRRIRSYNVVGGISQGRVQKAMPGAPQRSPMAWSFADAVSSPKAARHVSAQQSAGSLAPPTPSTPGGFAQQEPMRAHPSWQASGHFNPQPSIHETDMEHGVMMPSAASLQNFSSPPHTPMYYPQPSIQQRMAANMLTENTPPQSAPATQQCFSSQALNMPQMTNMRPQYQPQFTDGLGLEQQFQASFPIAQSHAPRQVQQQMPPPVQHQVDLGGMPYSQLVPIINAQGEIEMVVPSQIVRQQHHNQHHAQMQPQPQQMQTPMPQKRTDFKDMVGMFSTAIPVTAPQPVALQPKPTQSLTQLFVHEYSPPANLKCAASPPRKTVDSTPKNYSFTNHGPLDFERGKRTRAAGAGAGMTASNSPASSTGTASNTS
ncbi:hypothetical protein LTR62_000430 [Meristemomyces frigidus]|uniref:Homeobox domain-containing protein n=1 Tax=Meristemomyces frigidus TaxID=1508187 RepID=A0AAN7TMN4_9PEZI|nr:hypothetical protein LTR62_000430 [Meristemomyces frigidus]